MTINAKITFFLITFTFIFLMFLPVAFAVDPDMQALVIDNGSGMVPVPEPATILLFAIGLLGVAGLSRKK